MLAAVLITMGPSSTTKAAVGMTHVAINVRPINPPITAMGPKGPTSLTTPSARKAAAPVASSAVPNGNMPAMRMIPFHSMD